MLGSIVARSPQAAAERLKVFISYSRADRAFAERLVAALEQRGLSPRIDTRDLPKLEDWRRELIGFIREADAVVFVVSSHSIASQVCRWELEQVAALNKRLAPIVLEPVADDRIPEQIAKINYLGFDPPNEFTAQADALVAALETNLGWLKDHTRLGELARRWDERGRANSFLLRGQDLEDAQRWIALHPRGAPEPTALHRTFIVRSRRGAVHRQRAVIAVAVAVALFGLALAAVAVWQRNLALEQTRRANESFSAAKIAADGLINDLAKNLRNVRGVSQETTRTVLTTADAVMGKLVRSSAATPDLQLSQVELFLQFGLTFWFVGDITNALDYIDRCLAVLDQTPAATLDAKTSERALSLRYDALIEKGNIQRVLGQLRRSLDTFGNARETAQALVAATPQSHKPSWFKLARAHGRIGDVMRSFRRFDDAEREYLEAKAIQTRFLAASPEDADWLLELSWSYNRLADNLLGVTNHEGLMTVGADRKPALAVNPKLTVALQYYANSTAIRRQLLARNPKDTRNLRDLIWSLTLDGMALLAVDTAQARTVLDEAIREVNQALDVDPKNTELLRYQANAYNFRGDGMLLDGRMADAFGEYEKGLRIRQGLSDTDPSNARWLRDLFYTLKRMFELNRIAGKDADAATYRARALTVGDRVRLKFPNDDVLSQGVDDLRPAAGTSASTGAAAQLP